MAMKPSLSMSSVNAVACGSSVQTQVSLTDVIATARPAGLAEFETWALLCQAVQAMQDLFLSDGVFGGNFLPLITPQSVLLTGRGRVVLDLSRSRPVTAHFGSFLAPEYQHGRKYQDQEIEKMLVYSLAQTLRRCCVAQFQPHSNLHHLLLDATRLRSAERSTLMHLLEVISEYSRRREQTKPFSHTVMDLYKETIMYQNNKPLVIFENPYYIKPNILDHNISNRNDFLHRISENPIKIPYKSQPLNRAIYASMEQISNFEQPKLYGPGNRPRSICTKEELFQNVPKTLKNIKKARNPVKRAASRLYKADLTKIEKCIGPEFVVRAGLGSKKMVLADPKVENTKSLLVIMLNGTKLEIVCKPETTAGLLLEKIVQNENIEENFFLGLSILISGDFVFLPSDIKLSKIIPNDSQKSTFTLFVRVRFYLPSIRGLRNPESRHLLYLQLRRNILENQLPCNINQLCELGGFALQAEFGDFSTKHESNHYFLIEHYIPESLLEMGDQFREKLTLTHIKKKGMAPEKAEENFITLAQNLEFYGAHFYSATWVSKTKNENVWVQISAQGLSIFERDNFGVPSNSRNILETFKWQNIQTLCYSKHFLCILPHSSFGKKLKKYKLRMENKKSYYTFRLASLHHQFFLRLRTEFNSLHTLSQQFGILLKDIKNEKNSLFKLTNLDSEGSEQPNVEFRIHNSNLRLQKDQNQNPNFEMSKCRRSKSVIELSTDQNLPLEEFQNKENEGPILLNTRTLPGARKGVIMGTKAFSNSQRFCRSLETVNAWNSEEKISSSSPSRLSTVSSGPQNDAYVINSSIKSCEDPFLPNLQETLSQSLEEKLKNVSFTDERILKSVTVFKDISGSLGIQIIEGTDGKAYIQSVVPFSPASLTGNIFKGDQIVAVNGQSLQNIKYLDILEILKNTGTKVELILSQISNFGLSQNGNLTLSRIIKSPNKNNSSLNICDLCNTNLNCSNTHSENRFSGSKCNFFTTTPLKSSFNVQEESRPLKSLNFEPLYQDSRPDNSPTCLSLNNFDNNSDKCNISIPNIALPRSLGLGRKWRGPVRYPVTPIKHVNPNDSSYIISDDEQIFI